MSVKKSFLLTVLSFFFYTTIFSFSNIVVDPGHGGYDLGANVAGVHEKFMNHDVSRRLERALIMNGFNVILTRNKDEFISLKERSKIASKVNRAIFISIHFNSSSRKNANGVETFYHNKKSYPLAKFIQQEIITNSSSTNRGAKKRSFAVLKYTNHPSVLVEGGFISNRYERKALKYPEYRQYIADSVTRGIIRYKNNKLKWFN